MKDITGNRSMRTVHPPRIRSQEKLEQDNYSAWQAWLKELTPDERAALELDPLMRAPRRPKPRNRARRIEEDEETPGVGTCDHLASTDLNPLEALKAKEVDEAITRSGSLAAKYEIDETTRRDLTVLSYLLPEVIDAPDPRFVASVMALALGIGPRQKITIPGLGERHGIRTVAVLACVEEWKRRFDLCPASVTVLRLVVSPILTSRNPRLEAESIALAARFGLDGVSMTERGEFHGVCKAAISARVRRWAGRLGLALPRDCKEQTENYVLFNVRKAKPKTFAE